MNLDLIYLHRFMMKFGDNLTKERLIFSYIENYTDSKNWDNHKAISKKILKVLFLI
jgi:hypothetical protein